MRKTLDHGSSCKLPAEIKHSDNFGVTESTTCHVLKLFLQGQEEGSNEERAGSGAEDTKVSKEIP